jgi:hypothetical protein
MDATVPRIGLVHIAQNLTGLGPYLRAVPLLCRALRATGLRGPPGCDRRLLILRGGGFPPRPQRRKGEIAGQLATTVRSRASAIEQAQGRPAAANQTRKRVDPTANSSAYEFEAVVASPRVT